MGFSRHGNLMLGFLVLSCFYLDFGTSLDTITASQFIKDPQTLSSPDSAFTLGFFSPENTASRYVGIWYLSESNILWVANRDQPLQDSSGVVTISEDNNLVVLNGKNQVVWSSNVSNIASNSTAQLLNSGNLVLQDDTRGNTLWESFKHPSHTFFPNIQISTNPMTGEQVKVTSWKSPSDPAIGNFSVSLERLNVPELFLWNHAQPYWRSGPWNSRSMIGMPLNKIDSPYLNGIILGREEDGTVYISYSFPNSSVFGAVVLSSHGRLNQITWVNKQEVNNRTFQDTDCDIYGFCGNFGYCNPQSLPICTCLTGFEPRNVEEWKRHNWTSGCKRRKPLQCERIKSGGKAGKGDGFLKLQTTKVPDFIEQSSVSEDACISQCLRNCSCIAYAYDPGIGCMSWSGNLIDIQKMSSGGADLYIRVANSELGRGRDVKVIITPIVIIGTIAIATCAYLLWRRTTKYSGRRSHRGNPAATIFGDQEKVDVQELPLYDFRNIAIATNNFHCSNKLGEGGFGSVYKGELQDGQKIAVKRLSTESGQGLEEFMNEALVISKLQHFNLVRLLGCCIEGQEKMLIYEYMPNKSLDALLFDPVKKKDLDWPKRFNIIEGISRGLLYLHRDSRLKIIHRDLKVSNILLDGELNPKISDFGMARIFGGNDKEANTRRVVGTFGYMPPEYAFRGLFSEKSDVFSFGVLLLEIISGSKISSYYDHDQSLSLLGYAWKLWNEEDILSLIDPEISNPDYVNDITRCIHVGLLCVQELARERPNVATVVSMLNSEIVTLPLPSHPAFIERQIVWYAESSQQNYRTYSINNVTVTNMQGR